MSLSSTDRLLILSPTNDVQGKTDMTILSTDKVLVMRNGDVKATEVGLYLADPNVKTLFTSGVGGTILDIQDLSTMWQDTAATIPAAVGSRVALVQDKSGNGCNAYQTTTNLMPFLRQDSGGAYYLEANGTVWMYLGDTAAKTNLSTMVLCTTNRLTTTGVVLVGKPQATTHTDPYFRWVMYRSNTDTRGTTFNIRLNGAISEIQNVYHNQDLITLIDTTGIIKCGGYQVSVTPTTLTYPNSVQARLFSNVIGGEIPSGRLYRLVMVGKAVTTSERKLIERWAYNALP